MVLCPLCHDAATKGALPVERQRWLKGKPYNQRRGYASGALLVNQSGCAVAAGGVLLVGEGPLIEIDEEPLLEVYVGEDGELQVSLNLQDESGNSLAIVDRNEWVAGDPSIWDLECDHQVLKIRQAPRRIALILNAQGSPARIRADLWNRGQLVSLNSDGVRIQGQAVHNSSIQNLGLVGMALRIATSQRSLSMVPYLGNGMIVSEADPIQRLVKSLNAWEKIKNKPSTG